MAHGFPKSHREARAEAFRAALFAVQQPAFAVDVQAAEIIAANAAGASALGLFAYADYPVAIEAGIPALQRLRQIASTASNGDTREELEFAFVGRPRTLLCRIARDTVMADAGVMLVQVLQTLEEPAAEIAPLAHARAPAPPFAEGPSDTTAVLRTDAQTLLDIARHIREGLAQLEPIALPAPSTYGSPSTPPENPSAENSSFTKPLAPDDLARLAHELKTPLSAIAAAAEIMRDQRLGPLANDRYRSYAADIHDSAQHALNVIIKLLQPDDATKHGASVINLDDLSVRVVSMMQPLAEARAIRLAARISAAAPSVIADPTAMRQILLNLLTNAIKFTPEGGDVRVVTGLIDDGRPYLAVSDTGFGMDATREGAVSTARGQGIGLPLVRKLVADMGAEIEIDSSAGKGTVVLIVFPSSS